MTLDAPAAQEPVLSTLHRDGSRRWLRPKQSKGRHYYRRLAVAWALIAVFTVIPYLRMNGKPLVLLDIVNRKFTLFGTTFLPTDTFLLMLLVVTVLVGIFLLTAVLGRAWCGWACPQTVYMEFLYRPLERLIEGGRNRQLILDRTGPDGRRLLRYLVFVPISMFLAHTFLAYFVGVEQLYDWVQGSPLNHPVAFLVMAGVTVAMLFDFGFFREQTCLVACPYGRFQSVLLDRHSMIVGYDAERGEPRSKGGRKTEAGFAGDCIDCKLCVTTCPTGIDIRNGLQMECIHCTQCIDACDAVMEKVKKPKGLIRYSSQAALAGEKHRLFRPRLVLYPGILAVAVTLLVLGLVTKSDTDLAVLRASGEAFRLLPDGSVANRFRVKITNRSAETRDYQLQIVAAPGAKIVAPDNPVEVASDATETAAIFVTAPPEWFHNGPRRVDFRVSSASGYEETVRLVLLGPRSGRSAQKGGQ